MAREAFKGNAIEQREDGDSAGLEDGEKEANTRAVCVVAVVALAIQLRRDRARIDSTRRSVLQLRGPTTILVRTRTHATHSSTSATAVVRCNI